MLGFFTSVSSSSELCRGRFWYNSYRSQFITFLNSFPTQGYGPLTRKTFKNNESLADAHHVLGTEMDRFSL
ncbi:unnamed protein product [Cylicostephanus goldi]|uniref:Uncharacterized protein n=1 Tax=Cylicostephanus goldi TaxID=71465 RepID=A0A3P6S887_CYLGO|nr:unnamed protein product [Cylicostephanus goldi]